VVGFITKDRSGKEGVSLLVTQTATSLLESHKILLPSYFQHSFIGRELKHPVKGFSFRKQMDFIICVKAEKNTT
jgi:hypothetical protein